MYKIRDCRFSSGEHLPLLVAKSSGLPDLHVLEFCMTVDRAVGKSPATIEMRVRGLGIGLTVFEHLKIDLLERLASGAFLSDAELRIIANRCRTRESGSGPVGGGYAATRFQTVVEFLLHRSAIYLARARGERHKHLLLARNDFEKRANRIKPRSRSASNSAERLGLEPLLRGRFLQVIDPDFVGNPFRPKLRQRNHALMLLAFHYGFRSGELAGFKRDDVTDIDGLRTITVHRRPDDADDSRVTPARQKTRARTIIIHSDDVIRALDVWLQQRRERAAFPNAHRQPYLFVNRVGKPLALRTLRGLYNRLSSMFPELTDLCNHVLRHDMNDRWIEKSEVEDWDPDGANADQCYLNGWAPGSKQPENYAKRAIRTRASKRLGDMNTRTRVRGRAAND